MWLLFRAWHNSITNLLLIHQFKTQYRFSEAYHMSQMRDLPPIASAIIWARQIKQQLLTYLKHVKDVLGKGWELYAEGQRARCLRHGYTTSTGGTWELTRDCVMERSNLR
jgi:Dynein heavy chain, N-terminal region 1